MTEMNKKIRIAEEVTSPEKQLPPGWLGLRGRRNIPKSTHRDGKRKNFL
jgi:hypothetical protein